MSKAPGTPLITTADNMLPGDELSRLTEAVREATESGRSAGGSSYYTTFWYDLGSEPGNAVEKAISTALRARIPDSTAAGLVGAEWWLGRLSAPYSTNFEFGVHQDFGLNPVTRELEHPQLSSVFYLTSVDDGALTVFSGEPDLKAPDREYVFPRANMFAMFPGTKWHVVAAREDVLRDGDPEPPREGCDELRLTVTVNWWNYRPASHTPGPMRQIAGDYTGEIYPELRTRFTEFATA